MHPYRLRRPYERAPELFTRRLPEDYSWAAVLSSGPTQLRCGPVRKVRACPVTGFCFQVWYAFEVHVLKQIEFLGLADWHRRSEKPCHIWRCARCQAHASIERRGEVEKIGHAEDDVPNANLAPRVDEYDASFQLIVACPCQPPLCVAHDRPLHIPRDRASLLLSVCLFTTSEYILFICIPLFFVNSIRRP
jgi:hypothetical protein